VVIFKSETELSELIDKHDELVRRCVAGELDFWDFYRNYNSFYLSYALDGHESDREEQVLLKRHEDRIKLHRDIKDEIDFRICSDEDAVLDSYKQAGFFGSVAAISRLREIWSRSQV